VHGIAFNDAEMMRREFEKFKTLSGIEKFGIRIHYLRHNMSTPGILDRAGYLFDSSIMELEDFRIEGDLVEFPVHIMDIDLFKRIQRGTRSQRARRLKEMTVGVIEQCEHSSFRYFNLLFHDRYYSEAFVLLKDWYEWLVRYLKARGYRFISMGDAAREVLGGEK